MTIAQTLKSRWHRPNTATTSRATPAFIQKAGLAFARLARRDQLALLFLTGFLVIFGLGFGGWTLHQASQKAQKDYTAVVADLFWLRSQAGNIATSPTQSLPPAEAVKQLLSQAGITAQVVDNAGKLQINFSHSQASVISNVIAQLSQQGFTIEQLQIVQPSLDKLEATISVSK